MKTPWFSKARKPCCGVRYSNICRPWCVKDEDFEGTICGGTNTNVCVAEGCYGFTCKANGRG